MSEQEQRGGQPQSTDENAPAPTERSGDEKPAADKSGGSQPGRK